ncbi:DarT1-associated NADAR antitoxin family protein [Staphylococcus pettenkoferi]|uniref:DarT1-associated NADAR antitoxin family protein n=1 Tax=Staphylococcus pettenkoferi TaxID=170573 RepID=UPI001F5AB79B|nr:hypothetical protein [Staphylococcus pettenkoferi]MCI2802792.1 hypothetical protein [Staphylococcus pettenkoferi]
MAYRYVYYVDEVTDSFEKEEVAFKWYSGFAIEQKQKSIESLHMNFIKKQPRYNILEVSSKSKLPLGKEASSFNLTMRTKQGKEYTLEQVFQSSKVYKEAGSQNHLLAKGYSSREMKKILKEINKNDEIVAFECFNQAFSLEPKTLFYNWIYVNTLAQNKEIAHQILEYDAFTDIEFNPKKAINCQAEACSIFVSLSRQNKLQEALRDVESFKKTVYRET